MSAMTPAVEQLDYEFQGPHACGSFEPVLVGVVGSGNLEVLVEPGPQPLCSIHVETSARGFGAIWEAVFRDFHGRHGLGGVRISIHDMGATPAVVGLRLSQALAELQESAR